MSDANYVLDILSAEGEPSTRTIHDETIVIGRREGDIVIDDTGASGRHAEVRFTSGRVEVSDLGSTNGVVWNNGIVREPFSVAVGETFQIGRTKFTLSAIHLPSPALEPEPPLEEDDDEEEATAFISAAELGMEDLPEAPETPEPTPTPPEELPVETETASEELKAEVLPEPAEEVPPKAPLEEDDDEDEEATAWMSAVDEEGQPESAGPTSSNDWMDEPAPNPEPEIEPERSEATAVSQPQVSEVAHAQMEQPGETRRTTQVIEASELRPCFRGEGGELFKIIFLQGLLMVITMGIYAPWFICNLTRYMASRTVYGPTQQGWVYFRFHGTGGDLFVKFIVGYLLTMVTFGIYGAWFVCDLARWFLERSDAVAEEGVVYQLQFDMQGGALFVTLLVNYLLTLVTFGIYGAWAYCKVRSAVMSHLHLFEDSEHVGTFQFTGQGGQLLPFMLVQILLSMVTLGIYVPWAYVRTMQFMNQHTRVYYRERWFQADFTGAGGTYFLLNLTGILLTQLTLGIYFAWYFAKKQAFEIDNEVWIELT